MKITFAVDTIRPVGGIQKYAVHTADRLRERGHEVNFYSWYPDAFDGAPRDHGTLGTLPELRSFDPDVIHNNGLFHYDRVREMNDVAPVLEFLHIYNECADGGRLDRRNMKACDLDPGWGCWKSILSRRCMESSNPAVWIDYWKRSRDFIDWLADAPAIVANSRYTASTLDFTGRPVEVVPLTLVDDPRDPSAPEPGSCIRFLFAGRPAPEKGIDAFLEAAGRLRGEFEIQLALTSTNRHVESLLARYDSLPIRICETLDYGLADVVVMPSIFPEPFGLVGLEAFNASRPVIAFDVGGIGEWHGGSDTGVLVPAGDIESLAEAMQGYLNEPERVTAHGLAAHGHVRSNFSPDRHAIGMEAHYRRLAESRA